LLRAAVVRMGEDDWRLCLTVHHLVIDALAFNRVLLPEIAALYTEFAGGKPAGLAPLSMHFADYAVGRQRQIAGKPIASRTKWWGRTLSGAPGTVPLP